MPVTWRPLQVRVCADKLAEGRAGGGAVSTGGECPGDVKWTGRQGPGRQEDALTLHHLLFSLLVLTHRRTICVGR